jgi:hypothetical protein
MPRNVRNFWLELTVDGKKTRMATGPVRKDGGFDLVIKMRDKGQVLDVGEIFGRAEGNLLKMRARFIGNNEGAVIVAQTERD